MKNEQVVTVLQLLHRLGLWVMRASIVLPFVATVVVGAIAGYWWLAKPDLTPPFDFSKRGKPDGVLIDGKDGKTPVRIADIRGNWTLIAFVPLGYEVTGYDPGNSSYTYEVARLGTTLGRSLTELKSRLAPHGYKIWVVRMDRQHYEGPISTFTESCKGKCYDRYLLAAQRKGGKYDDYYGPAHAWLDKEWVFRLKPGQRTIGGFLPVFAILDPAGEMRLLTSNNSTAIIYTAAMNAIGKAPESQAYSLPDGLFKKYVRASIDNTVSAFYGTVQLVLMIAGFIFAVYFVLSRRW